MGQGGQQRRRPLLVGGGVQRSTVTSIVAAASPTPFAPCSSPPTTVETSLSQLNRLIRLHSLTTERPLPPSSLSSTPLLSSLLFFSLLTLPSCHHLLPLSATLLLPLLRCRPPPSAPHLPLLARPPARWTAASMPAWAGATSPLTPASRPSLRPRSVATAPPPHPPPPPLRRSPPLRPPSSLSVSHTSPLQALSPSFAAVERSPAVCRCSLAHEASLVHRCHLSHRRLERSCRRLFVFAAVRSTAHQLISAAGDAAAESSSDEDVPTSLHCTFDSSTPRMPVRRLAPLRRCEALKPSWHWKQLVQRLYDQQGKPQARRRRTLAELLMEAKKA